MGSYLDSSDAALIALTRQRRAELAERRARPQPIRFTASEPSSEFVVACLPANGRDSKRSRAWRRAQWKAGNRDCTYCHCRMIAAHLGRPAPNMATVDHREPVVAGGDDAAWNWAMACWLCNNRKGAMTEAEFRALLDVEKNPPAWVDGGRLTA